MYLCMDTTMPKRFIYILIYTIILKICNLFCPTESQIVEGPALCSLDDCCTFAINSSIDICVNVTPTRNGIVFYWEINNTMVGAIYLNDSNYGIVIVLSSEYQNRVFIRNNPTQLQSSHETFVSTLTLDNLQASESRSLAFMFYGWPGTMKEFTPILDITYCPSLLPFMVFIASSETTYEANGVFGCSNKGKLFYSNGTKLLTNQTTCLASAHWSGEENLQCWTAPRVTLTGQMDVKNGTSLKVFCEYSDVIPLGNISSYYFGSKETKLAKNQMYTSQNLQPEDNKKLIFCQADTPYTNIYPHTGRSKTYAVNVMYNSYQSHVLSCEWFINESNWCNVTFYANPKPQFVSLTKCGAPMVINDAKNGIVALDNDIHIFLYHKNKVDVADSGSYNLVVSSSAFPEDVTIFFNINVMDDPKLANTAKLCRCEQTSLVVISCIAAIAVAAVIGLLVKLQQITKNIDSKRNATTESAADESGYIEFQSNIKTGFEKKNIGTSSSSYININAKSATDEGQVTASVYLNELHPTNNAGYVDIYPSSSGEKRNISNGDNGATNASDYQQDKATHEFANTASKTDRNYEVIQ